MSACIYLRHFSAVNNKYLFLQEGHIQSLKTVQFDYINTFFSEHSEVTSGESAYSKYRDGINSCQPPTLRALESPLYSIQCSGEQSFEIKTFSLFLSRERRWHVS